MLCCSGCTLESTSTNHSGMTKLNTPKKLRSLSYSHLPSPHALILLTSPIITCTYPTHISHHPMHLSYSHLPSSHALILLTSPIITCTYPTHISHHHIHLSYSHLPSSHALILLTSPIITCTYPTHISRHHIHLSYCVKHAGLARYICNIRMYICNLESQQQPTSQLSGNQYIQD